jgi:hypothetical protein
MIEKKPMMSLFRCSVVGIKNKSMNPKTMMLRMSPISSKYSIPVSATVLLSQQSINQIRRTLVKKEDFFISFLKPHIHQ